MSRPDSESAVRTLVERALLRIDDDAPDYGEPLLELAQSPAALAILGALPELGRPLFAELRKLRPLALWVRDSLELALAKKRDAVLDGAVCSIGAGSALLAPEGRECWLEVDAQAAESTLRGLPAGWGLIVIGDLSRVSFLALRKASPLRALGAALDGAAGAACLLSEARLDLVIVREPGRPPDAALGARMLWSVHSPEQLRLAPEAAPSVGVLCDGNAALACALRLATMRQPSGGSR
ncbi:MAG: hypothetical protein JWN04_246 [Myxococcaceae bacterium]|nr:hypothetical protein [Myxococcaceae bacterium]